jgi:predicted DNA-binding protein YlxM (UPF0122 family)
MKRNYTYFQNGNGNRISLPEEFVIFGIQLSNKKQPQQIDHPGRPPPVFSQEFFRLRITGGLPMYKEDKVYTRRVVLLDGKKHYYVSFQDSHGNTIETEVTEGVYKTILDFQRIEARIARSDRRHLEHRVLSDSEINRRKINHLLSTESIYISEKEIQELLKAIESFPRLQRRRFTLHRFDGFSTAKIAKIERCSRQAVEKSIAIAEKKLYELRKKFSDKGCI